MIRKFFRVLSREGFSGLTQRILLKLQAHFLDKNKYDQDFLLDDFYNYSTQDLERNAQIISTFTISKNRPIRTVNWFFIPSITHPMGGVSTIFRFARYLVKERKVTNNFILCGNAQFSEKEAAEKITMYVPNITEENIFKVSKLEDLKKVPASDIAIATRWDTAFHLLRFNKTKGKFYFIQDFEPLFFPASLKYMLAESTYRFGFFGIANTIGLCEEYKQYSSCCEYFTPGVDKSIYFPRERHQQNYQEPVNIFFYARPGVLRNGFELGVEVLKKLKNKYGKKIRIYTAGAVWNSRDFNLDGVVENLGMLENVREVAELYRKCDIGLSFIFTKHPSYQPIEFMASGVAVVTNKNRYTHWLLKDGINCLLTEPTVSDVVEKIDRLISNPALREKLIREGLKTIAPMDWDSQWEKIWSFIQDPL